jgi:hypothetical protein
MGKARKEPLSQKRNSRNLKKKSDRISKTIFLIKAIEQKQKNENKQQT